MDFEVRKAVLRDVPTPPADAGVPVPLEDRTMDLRLQRVLERMRKRGLDALAVYCDLEHGGNFEYLTGFVTRFEEALLVLKADGKAALMVGNENLKLAARSRLPARVLHCPHFSLPDQPMEGERPLEEVLRDAGLERGMRVGLVGWKLLRSGLRDTRRWFDLPSYMAEAVRETVGEAGMENATDLMIGPDGARTVNSANEIAHYEYGAALSSDCVLRTVDALAPGMTELELGSLMNAHGQHCSVVTVCASGPRFEKANLFPTAKRLALGETMSLTCGYRGGLASRAGYLAESADQLPEGARDYLETLAAPYFSALAAWLENLRVGVTGGEMYALTERALPREEYHWGLCPGHLTAEEEWLSSPIRKDSSDALLSGMLLQADIIPSRPGYGGVSCENGVALADASLRADIRREYPDMWERMTRRREFVVRRLNIRLPEEVLPMCSGLAYCRPYLLRRGSALVCE